MDTKLGSVDSLVLFHYTQQIQKLIFKIWMRNKKLIIITWVKQKTTTKSHNIWIEWKRLLLFK